MVMPFPEIQKQSLFRGGTKGAFRIDDPRSRSLHAERGSLPRIQHDFAVAIEGEETGTGPMHRITEFDASDRIDSDRLVETGRERCAERLPRAGRIRPGACADLDSKIVVEVAGQQQTADGRQADARRLGSSEEDSREPFGSDLQQTARVVVHE
jgi:hypothetical protein